MAAFGEDYADDFEEERSLQSELASLKNGPLSRTHSSVTSMKDDGVRNMDPNYSLASRVSFSESTPMHRGSKSKNRIVTPFGSLSPHSYSVPNSALLHVSKITAVQQLDPELPTAYRRAHNPSSVSDEHNESHNCLSSNGNAADHSDLEGANSQNTPYKDAQTPTSPLSTSPLERGLNHSTTLPGREAMASCSKAKGAREVEDTEAHSLPKRVKSPLITAELYNPSADDKARKDDFRESPIINSAARECISTRSSQLGRSSGRYSSVDRRNEIFPPSSNIFYSNTTGLHDGMYFPPLLPFLVSDPVRDSSGADQQSSTSANRTDPHSHSAVLSASTPLVWKRHAGGQEKLETVSQQPNTVESNNSQYDESPKIASDITGRSQPRDADTDAAPTGKVRKPRGDPEFTPYVPKESKYSRRDSKKSKAPTVTKSSRFPPMRSGANQKTHLTPKNSGYSSAAQLERKDSATSLTRAELLSQIRELKLKLAALRRERSGSANGSLGVPVSRGSGESGPGNVSIRRRRVNSDVILPRLRRENAYLRRILEMRRGEGLNTCLLIRMAAEGLKHALEELKEMKKRRAELVTEDRRASINHRNKAKIQMTHEELRTQQNRDGLYTRAALESKLEEMREKLENMKISKPHLLERIESLESDLKRRGLSDISPEEYSDLKVKINQNELMIRKLKNSISVHASPKSLSALDKVPYSSEEDLSNVDFPNKEEMERLLRNLIRQVEKKEKQIMKRRLTIGTDTPPRLSQSSQILLKEIKQTPESKAQDTSGVPMEGSPVLPASLSQSHNASKNAISPRDPPLHMSGITSVKSTLSSALKEAEKEAHSLQGQSRSGGDSLSQALSGGSKQSLQSASKAASLNNFDLNLPIKRDLSTDSSSGDALEALRRRIAALDTGNLQPAKESLVSYSEGVEGTEFENTPTSRKITPRQSDLWLSPSILALGTGESPVREDEEAVEEDNNSGRNTPMWLRG